MFTRKAQRADPPTPIILAPGNGRYYAELILADDGHPGHPEMHG
jgi:hypothetical protein